MGIIKEGYLLMWMPFFLLRKIILKFCHKNLTNKQKRITFVLSLTSKEYKMKNIPLDIQVQISSFVPDHKKEEFTSLVEQYLAFDRTYRIKGAQIIFEWSNKCAEYWGSVAYVRCFDEIQERQGRYN